MKSRSCNIWKKRITQSVIICAVLLAIITARCSSLSTGVPKTGCYKREGLDTRIEAVIDEFRDSVPEMMKKGKIPGVAIALVDNQGILWTEGFGYTDRKRNIPVTPDTLFAICSMSKTFTATAVMLAVRDRLVDLDEPITTYLPDFRVYSRFEEHPEEKITLRHLLSHTAGLPGEAPLGNNFEPSATVSFEDHVKSIFGTWLVCAVGKGFVYCNTGPDLAAYILQVVSGKPFEQYMKERLFAPLGMSNSAVGKEALKSTNRAVGHQIGFSETPAVPPPILGAGGVFTTAKDLATFVQFHLNRGNHEGKTILEESLFDIMYEPVTESKDNRRNGLCIVLDNRNEGLMLHHGGGGFGFSSYMLWFPEYGMGTVVVTNRVFHPFTSKLATTVLDRLIKDRIISKRFTLPEPSTEDLPGVWKRTSEHNSSLYRPQWRKYCGTYRFRFSGYKLKWWARLALALDLEQYTPRIKVYQKDGYLCLTESRFLGNFWDRQVAQKLEEVRPGLFLTASGGALDFRGEIPAWRNYRLKKR